MRTLEKIRSMAPVKKALFFSVLLFALNLIAIVFVLFQETDRRILPNLTNIQFTVFAMTMSALYSMLLSFLGVGCELFKKRYGSNYPKKYKLILVASFFFILISMSLSLSMKPELINSKMYVFSIYSFVIFFLLSLIAVSLIGWYSNRKI